MINYSKPRINVSHLITSALLAMALLPAQKSFASIDDMVEALANSELKFSRVASDVPFIPVGWAHYRHYAAASFNDFAVDPALREFKQSEMNAGLILPLYVGKRDLIVTGLDVSYDQFIFKSSARNAEIVAATPMLGWLRQVNTDDQFAAFVAPMLSSALGDTSRIGVQAFAGLLGMHQANDRLTWIYGGVYQYSFGAHFVYPYLGMQWLPNSHWAVSLIAPWPTVAYAPNKKWFFNAGVAPGGASWRIQNSHQQSSAQDSAAAFGSWNLVVGAGYNVTGRYWLHAQVGMAAMRSLQISDTGDSQLEARANSKPLYSLSVEFRP